MKCQHVNKTGGSMKKNNSLIPAIVLLGSTLITCGLIVKGMMVHHYIFKNEEGKILGAFRMNRITGNANYTDYTHGNELND